MPPSEPRATEAVAACHDDEIELDMPPLPDNDALGPLPDLKPSSEEPQGTESFAGTGSAVLTQLRARGTNKKGSLTRVSNLVMHVDTDKEAHNQKIIKQLQKWDKDGDGEITLEDIVDGARTLIEQESRSSRLRRLLIASLFFGIISCASVFGITKAVVESSKETYSDDSARLTNREGVVVSTAEAAVKIGLADLTRLPMDVFKQVHRLTFATDSGEYFTQVAFAAKTPSRLKITGQDGLKMECTAAGCEAEFADGRTERIWVNTTGNGRFLEAHEFPTIDMAFAGYDAARFQQLLDGSAGHPGDFSLDSALALLEGGATCQDGVQVGSLAEACGMEPSTNVVVDSAAACSERCVEAYSMIMDLCGLSGESSEGAGRRLASSDGGARTAAELLTYLGRFSLEHCGDSQAKDWSSTGGAGIGAKWSTAKPTSMTLTKTESGMAFLTQTIRGVRLLKESGESVDGVEPLLFTPENSWVDSTSTEDADFVTVYSVLRLGEKSALRVVISQLLAKAGQTIQKAQIGPTSVCLGPIDPEHGTCVAKNVDAGHLKFSIFVEAVGDNFALPASAAKIGIVLGLNPAQDATLVAVPYEHLSANGAVSMGRLVMKKGDGSKLWQYKFEQSYNIDNAQSSTDVLVHPTAALPGTVVAEKELHVQIALAIGGETGALTAPGSFVVYDPETFSGNERLTASKLKPENMELDQIAIAAASLVYLKFNTTEEAAQENSVKMDFLFRKSRKFAGWHQVYFSGDHICAKDRDNLVFKHADQNLCENGGGKMGALYGPHNGEMVGMVAFAGTDDLQDGFTDLCAGVGGFTKNMHGKVAALGFHNAYLMLREHFKAVLNDLKNLGCTKIVITGHSLGGSVAALATWDMYNSYELAGGYFMDKHLRTVTLGEPAPWEFPNVPFNDIHETVEQVVVSNGRRRFICSGDQRRRFTRFNGCDTVTEQKKTVHVTPKAEFMEKYHRYVTSAKQTSPHCQFWESGIFGIGATSLFKYECEQHDWDVVAGLATLSGNGVHGTRNTYWIGFDATKAFVPGEEKNVVNLYKESQTDTEFLASWMSADILAEVPGFLQTWLGRFFCNVQPPAIGMRRLEGTEAAAPARQLDTSKARRLGLFERLALHHQFVYYYWTARAVCEETGVDANNPDSCDCPFFCLAWNGIKADKWQCGLIPSFNVCDQSKTDYFATDYLHKPEHCNCEVLLKER